MDTQQEQQHQHNPTNQHQSAGSSKRSFVTPQEIQYQQQRTHGIGKRIPYAPENRNGGHITARKQASAVAKIAETVARQLQTKANENYNKIQVLRRQEQDVKTKLDALPADARWSIRERNLLQTKLQGIRKELARCLAVDFHASGGDLQKRQLEEKARPYILLGQYLEMVRKQSLQPSCGDMDDNDACDDDGCVGDAAHAHDNNSNIADNCTDDDDVQHLLHAGVTAEDLEHELLVDFDDELPLADFEPQDDCPRCKIPLVLSVNNHLLKCTKCPYNRIYIDATSASMAYGDEVEFSSFAYKRINHFIEWLFKFQGKENSQVDKEVCKKVSRYIIRTLKIRDRKLITREHVREALRAQGLRKHYNHVVRILWKITNIPPLRMTPDQEEQCKDMFMKIQAPFFKIKDRIDPNRKNFLSYSYCLYKFCQIRGWTRFLPCFSLLKGKSKLMVQDRFFKAICEEVGWKFVPSKPTQGITPRSR